ncbi:putative nucleotide-diphospho-sugar transferase [Chitinibacter sp. ZOR0017]|uniref:putative nucleotide-diphospho-sugar transferase n=1 Tax=Chitinibacter sp. ZOR0017 TaxID=1339254 RepID=UPI000645BD6B|nr:putative nucleotide-diphospho-sugar transferase [Chitinibacter sp. ZOR0017]
MENNLSIANSAVFSVCNIAYLPKALALAKSLYANNAIRLKIYIFDRRQEINTDFVFAEIIWIEDVGLEGLEKYAFKYDITEFSTSLKPYLALKLLELHKNVVFLDPDTFCFSSIQPIFDDLESHAIVLTPHYVTPHEPGDVGMMRFGSFNLGFFAVSQDEEALRFLKWWNERCLNLCYFETQFGLSTDQKWVSIAPCFFPGIYISFNLGYNVAFWNAHERKIGINNNGDFVVNENYPLIFFHFSSFNEECIELLSKRPFVDKEKKRQDLLAVSRIYAEELSETKKLVPKIAYTFDYMSDGSYISPSLRRAYASIYDELPEQHDPFDSDGVVGKFAKKNGLYVKDSNYSAMGFKDKNANLNKIKVVNVIMRLILKVIGPNKFMNLSQLLVFLSSYRLNRDLWKL